MKNNFIHVCFVIDESGSMSGSENDVVGGFKKIIDEQSANENGTCAISLYKFESKVSKLYIGRDIKEVKPLVACASRCFRFSNTLTSLASALDAHNDYDSECSYSPGGGTALFDGVGMAIDQIGYWLASLPEEERPEKNIIVIMTDGEENSSKEYTSTKVKEMIKHQEDVYNWTFMYLGTDIRNTNDAKSLGISNTLANVRSKLSKSYDNLNTMFSSYRCAAGDAVMKNAAFVATMDSVVNDANAEYLEDTGIKID